MDTNVVGRLTCSLPLVRASGLPVHIAQRLLASFCETPAKKNWRLAQTPYKSVGSSSRNSCLFVCISG
jgi:hypothetical protein